MKRADVVVVGAGLAGLAARPGRRGRDGRWSSCEKAGGAGGRAQTTAAGKFRLNLGPHALYCGGPAERALRELDVPIAGRKPNATRRLCGGARRRARAAGRLPVAADHRAVRDCRPSWRPRKLLGGLARLDPEPLQRRDGRASGWPRDVRQPEVRALVGALVRVTSYAADHDRMSAGAALAPGAGRARQRRAATSTAAGRCWSTASAAPRRAPARRLLTGARADAVVSRRRARRRAPGRRHARSMPTRW